jgi:hypothetical protein
VKLLEDNDLLNEPQQQNRDRYWPGDKEEQG